MSQTPLAPGSTIGILGGGQLGRMLSMAAARLGFRCHVFEPGAAPAAQVADAHTAAPYEDAKALSRFARDCDVITYEFENVPTEALDVIADITPVLPGRRALKISQDRLTEKDFLTGLSLRTARYRGVGSLSTLKAAIADLGAPSILKTRRLGYDGKGQVMVSSVDDIEDAFASLKGAPAILESLVTFQREVSVIVARGADGETVAFDPGENVHRTGILRTTTVPATLSGAQRTDAALIAARIAGALDYVGVMGVELFVTKDGLLVNEIAPRVHNSGHWTQLGCAIDQFEQHIRAVAGLPLGDGTRHCDVVMENLIGDDMDRLPGLQRESGVQVHLYGKDAVREGRKMGHINRLRRGA